jgi:hypothetical protein
MRPGVRRGVRHTARSSAVSATSGGAAAMAALEWATAAGAGERSSSAQPVTASATRAQMRIRAVSTSRFDRRPG